MSVSDDRAQRHCCHRRCLIAAAPDKSHKAWPLDSHSMDNPDSQHWLTEVVVLLIHIPAGGISSSVQSRKAKMKITALKILS